MNEEKFVVGFSITGSGQAQLKEIQAGFEAIAAAAAKGGAGGASAEMEKTAGAAKTLHGVLDALSLANLHTGLNTAEQSLGRLTALAGDLKNELVDAFKGAVKEAATFEDIESGLQFAFKDNWKNVYKEVKKDALNLTFTLQETAQLANAFGRMKVNPFGGDKEEDQLFMAKTGQRIRALEGWQDMADATGRDVTHLGLIIKNALGGQWMMYKNAIDQTPETFNKIKKAVTAAKTEQEKYNILAKESFLLFGGAGKLKDLNFNKVWAQLPDMVQQLKGSAAKEGVREVTLALKEFVGVTSQIPQSTTVIKGLSEAFKVFSSIAVAGVQAGTKITEFFAKLVEAFPWLPKVAAGLTALAVAFGLVAVVVMGGVLTAMIALVGVMMVGLPIAIFGVVLTVGALVAAFMGLAAAMATGYSLWSIFKTNMAGSMDSWEKVTTVISAVYEALQNWNKYAAGISDETKDKLESSGLMDVFLSIMTFVRDAKTFFEDFWHGFTNGIDQVTGPLKNSLLRTLEKLTVLLYAVFGIFSDGEEAIDNTAGAGERLGKTFALALEGVVDLATSAVDKIGEMAENGEATATSIAGIVDTLFSTIIVTSKLLAVVVQVGAAFATIGLIVNNVYSAVHFMVSALDTALKLLGLITGRQVHRNDERMSNGRFWGDMSFGERARYEMGEHRRVVGEDRARSLSLRGIADGGDALAKSLWNTESLEAQKKAWHESIVGAGRTIEHAYKNGHRQQAPVEAPDNSWIGSGFNDDLWGDKARARANLAPGNYGPRLPLSVTAPPGSSSVSGVSQMDEKEAMELATRAAAAQAALAESQGTPNASVGAYSQPIHIHNKSELILDGKVAAESVTDHIIEDLRRQGKIR